jgi:mannose-6-phosphate isomerase-like protein (cupin superfamily)
MKEGARMKFIAWIAAAALALPAVAQSSGNTAEVFSSHDAQSQLAALALKAKASGSSGFTFGDYGSHILMLSVRAADGKAEVHAHYDDVMVVTEGSATLITGGTVVDPQTEKKGETKGSGIRDGKSQTVTVGDILHIPAGVPHQFLVASGTTYSAFVVKVKE